jgi:outer membrane lipoprotein carrier protein
VGDRSFVAINKRWHVSPRLICVFRVLWLLIAGSLLVRAESTTDELIKKVEDRYNGVRTLSVNFVETYSILGHARPPEVGTLSLRKQGKMRWDYTRPEGKLFVSDGKNIYLYTAKDNRVEKVSLKDSEDMRAPLAFLLGRLDMKKDFRDFQVRQGNGGVWLDALAKDMRVPYDRVEMLISEGSIRELKVRGRDQSTLAYSFTNEKLNPPVGDEQFHFTIPPGAEVVDSIQFGSEGK